MKDGSISTEATDQPTSLAVVDRIADLEGTDPMELPPLYDAVDPDALDSLVRSPDAAGSAVTEVRFTYCGYDVRVSDGAIAVSTA